ncbi:unnamed protein product [Rotaria sp. Silwood1]|nr:unnamed protein product [Rotaria sp. Silwood1]
MPTCSNSYQHTLDNTEHPEIINKISNCSLLFQIQTTDHSNIIQTDFPIDLIDNYDLTCNLKNFTAYYKITPLSFLVIDKYKNEHENFKSMLELHVKQFNFSFNQSSTIQQCVFSTNKDNYNIQHDHKHQICRQIHIGINRLHHFWNLSMKIFYICLICSIRTCYI